MWLKGKKESSICTKGDQLSCLSHSRNNNKTHQSHSLNTSATSSQTQPPTPYLSNPSATSHTTPPEPSRNHTSPSNYHPTTVYPLPHQGTNHLYLQRPHRGGGRMDGRMERCYGSHCWSMGRGGRFLVCRWRRLEGSRRGRRRVCWSGRRELREDGCRRTCDWMPGGEYISI